MAGDRQTPEVAAARVEAAKARLTTLADEVRPGRFLLYRASSLMRHRPWQGLGVALIAGLALGVAPRGAVRRLAALATPVAGMVAGTSPTSRVGVRTRRPAARRRSRHARLRARARPGKGRPR